MINMLKVLQAMAIRTKYFKVRNFVIQAVSVLVMNAKNTRLFVVATPITCSNHIAFEHLFSDSRKFRAPFGSGRLAIALLRTKFPFMARMAYKTLSAMLASIGGFPLVSLRNIVTCCRAVFCFIAPRRNMCKCSMTY